MDAKERLKNVRMEPNPNMSLEEQLNSSDDNDDTFVDGMSDDARDAMKKTISENSTANFFDKPEVIEPESTEFDEEEEPSIEDTPLIQPVTLDDEPETASNPTSYNDIFNSNTSTAEGPSTGKRRGRRRREVPQEVNQSSSENMYNGIMDQLAKNLIDDLRSNKYRFGRFSDECMDVVFKYMYDKFI